MSNRYSVSGSWTAGPSTTHFQVQEADTLDARTGETYRLGASRVIDRRTGKAAKVGKGGTVPFYGESAWSDAERLMRDLEFAEANAVPRWSRPVNF